MSFIIKNVAKGQEQKTIEQVGFDSSYVNKVVDKYEFCLYKIFDLTPHQASIVKQSALAVGADAAVHREVITCKVEKSDVLVGGSKKQMKLICQKLSHQPFNLQSLANQLLELLNNELGCLETERIKFDWGSKTYLMGILNVTPDSFSDGGKFYSLEDALIQAQKIATYADIIDIGGESTRPYSDVVSVEDEINRVCPVIEQIRAAGIKTPISIDTRNSKTAEMAIIAGADIVNDVSGGNYDDEMLDVVAKYQVPYVIMHSVGIPQDMQDNPIYDKVVDDVYLDLSSKIDRALSKGIQKKNIIVDIGIGFGKNLDHNLEILSRVEEFRTLQTPLLVGVSRKSFMESLAGELSVEQKDVFTLSINSMLASKGVDIVRVHNPELHKKPLEIIDRLART